MYSQAVRPLRESVAFVQTSTSTASRAPKVRRLLSNSPQDGKQKIMLIILQLLAQTRRVIEWGNGRLVRQARSGQATANFFFAALNASEIAMKKRCISDVHKHPPSAHNRSQCTKGRDHRHSLYSERLREHRHPCGQFESKGLTLGHPGSAHRRCGMSEAFEENSEEDVYYRIDSMNC
jgi:hypothetical protein